MLTKTKPDLVQTIENDIICAEVDTLAAIKAQIAALQVTEKELTEKLKATGRDRLYGTLHEASISLAERTTVDTKRLRADLGEECIAPYLNTTLVTSLRITARKT